MSENLHPTTEELIAEQTAFEAWFHGAMRMTEAIFWLRMTAGAAIVGYNLAVLTGLASFNWPVLVSCWGAWALTGMVWHWHQRRTQRRLDANLQLCERRLEALKIEAAKEQQ
jgi:hypothetical protein